MTPAQLGRRLSLAICLLAPFSPARVHDVGGCNIEFAGAHSFAAAPLTITNDSDLELSGWVIDPGHANVPLDASIHLVSDKRRVVLPIRHRLLRGDVVALFQNDSFLIAGFKLTVPAKTLGTGVWHVTIHYRAESTEYNCDNGRRLNVPGASE